MKNFRKKFTVIAVLAAMVATVLTGCAKKFDAATYVKGTLDAYFKNEISDQYVKLVDGGKEAIQKGHDDQIEMLLDEIREMDASDELINQYRDMYIDLFSKCKYTIGEAVEDKSTNNFTVTVTVEPLKMEMEEIGTKVMTHITEWAQTQDQTDAEAYQAAGTEELLTYMLSLFQEALAAPEYLEAQTFDVHVNKGANNIYQISEDELAKVINTTTGLGV